MTALPTTAAALTAPAAPTPAGVNAPARDAFNTLACLSFAVATLAYCFAEPAYELAAFSMPIIFLGWYLAREGRPWALPRIVVNTLVFGAIARAAFSVLGSQTAVVSHLSEFLVLIGLIKLFDRRSGRDETQLLTLSIFVVMGAILTANTLSVGLFILLYAPFLAAAAMQLQIRSGLRRLAELRGVANPDTRATAPLRREGPRMRAHFTATVGVAVIAVTILAVIGFIFAPRYQLRQGGWTPLNPASRTQSVGFTDQVRLGQSGFLRPDDPTPVMDVQIIGAGNAPSLLTGPNTGVLYLRGATLDWYDSTTRIWRPRADVSLKPVGAGARHVIDGPIRNPGQLVEQRITLRNARQGVGYLFSLWEPRQIQFDRRESFGFYGPDRTLRRSGPADRVRYTVWSDPAGPGRPAPREDGIQSKPFPSRFTLPIGDHARELLTRAGIPTDPAEHTHAHRLAAARSIESHLRQNYLYTLEMTPPDADQDPIEMFLFDTRRGHCEYFASAMTALCQSVGIQARMVTGFVTSERNPSSDTYLVRQSNAHAWVEVNVGGDDAPRWMPFDPSPPGDIEAIHEPAPAGVFTTVRRWYETIESAWNSGVVSFDARAQANLLGGIRDPRRSALADRMQGLGDRLSQTLAARESGDADEEAGATSARKIAVLVLAAILFFAGAVVVARSAAARALLARLFGGAFAPRPDPAARPYRRALTALAGAGYAKPAHLPPLEFARQLTAPGPAADADRPAPLDPESLDLFTRIANLYYTARFAGLAPSPAELRTAENLAADLAARLRTR